MNDRDQEYCDLDNKFKQLEYLKIDKEVTKVSLVGLPLYYLGDVIFKNIFSYLIGFEWLLPYTYSFRFREVIGLPNISYKTEHIIAIPYEAEYAISSFVFEEDIYSVNAVNAFPLIPLNYLARNLGKMVGYLIASIVTIPFYVGINIFYGIRKAIKQYQITSIIDYLILENHEEFLQSWLSYTRPLYRYSLDWLNTFAQHIHANDFFTALLKHHCNNLITELAGNKRVLQDATNIYKELRNDYIAKRKKHLKNRCNWSLVITILSSVLVIPLFFTITTLLKNIKNKNEEIEKLDKINALIESITIKKTDKVIENSLGWFPPKREKKDYILLVEYAKEFIAANQVDVAYMYLKAAYNFLKKPSNHNLSGYKEAMFELGNAFLFINKNNLANKCFIASDDENAIFIGTKLCSDANASVAIVCDLKFHESKNQKLIEEITFNQHNTHLLDQKNTFIEQKSLPKYINSNQRGLDDSDDESVILETKNSDTKTLFSIDSPKQLIVQPLQNNITPLALLIQNSSSTDLDEKKFTTPSDSVPSNAAQTAVSDDTRTPLDDFPNLLQGMILEYLDEKELLISKYVEEKKPLTLDNGDEKKFEQTTLKYKTYLLLKKHGTFAKQVIALEKLHKTEFVRCTWLS